MRTAAGRATTAATATDAGMLVARVALAWIFVYHGTATLFGWFGGPGLSREETFYGHVAHLHPAVFFTVLGGSIECFGGLAVGLGLLGRLAAAALAGDMVMAMITVTFANGITSDRTGGGYELNLALAALALVVVAVGTGRLSLDRLPAFRRALPWARPRAQTVPAGP